MVAFNVALLLVIEVAGLVTVFVVKVVNLTTVPY